MNFVFSVAVIFLDVTEKSLFDFIHQNTPKCNTCFLKSVALGVSPLAYTKHVSVIEFFRGLPFCHPNAKKLPSNKNVEFSFLTIVLRNSRHAIYPACMIQNTNQY